MLKRLELPGVCSKLSYLDEDQVFFPPKIGKDGFYYDRKAKTAWCELQGKAWSVPCELFKEDFEESEHRPLSVKERELIPYLVKMGNCPDSLRRQLSVDDTHRYHRLQGLKVRQRFIKFMVERFGEAEAKERYFSVRRKNSLPLP